MHVRKKAKVYLLQLNWAKKFLNIFLLGRRRPNSNFGIRARGTRLSPTNPPIPSNDRIFWERNGHKMLVDKMYVCMHYVPPSPIKRPIFWKQNGSKMLVPLPLIDRICICTIVHMRHTWVHFTVFTGEKRKCEIGNLGCSPRDILIHRQAAAKVCEHCSK